LKPIPWSNTSATIEGEGLERIRLAPARSGSADQRVEVGEKDLLSPARPRVRWEQCVTGAICSLCGSSDARQTRGTDERQRELVGCRESDQAPQRLKCAVNGIDNL